MPGMRNRLAVLSEAYAYAPYKDRVLATRDFVRECLIQAAARKDKIIGLLSDAERAVVNAGPEPGKADRVPIRSEPRPLAGTEPILGYEEREENGRRVRTDKPRDYPAQLLHDFAATETVVRPYAYLLPAPVRARAGHAPAPRHRRPGAAGGHRAGRGALPGRGGGQAAVAGLGSPGDAWSCA